MGKKMLFLLTLLQICVAGAQTAEQKMQAVTTVADAKKFTKDFPDESARIIEVTDLEEGTIELFGDKNIGEVVISQRLAFKLLEKKPVTALRASYIYLDGSKLSMTEIDSLRGEIIKQYKNGSAFSKLAGKYTMDKNATGDLHWFTEGTMVPAFESAIKQHKRNAIFTVDVVEKHWYYVVLKTFDDMQVTEYTLLRIKE